MAAPPSAIELKSLASIRLKEAMALRDAGFNAGAWYLAGYSVELALKAVACKTLGLQEYPERVFKGSLKSHNPEELVLLAGLKSELDLKLQDAAFEQYWNLVITWDVQDRYRASRTQQDVNELLEALQETQNGVFVWLSSQW